jgi:hypothetical protein
VTSVELRECGSDVVVDYYCPVESWKISRVRAAPFLLRFGSLWRLVIRRGILQCLSTE